MESIRKQSGVSYKQTRCNISYKKRIAASNRPPLKTPAPSPQEPSQVNQATSSGEDRPPGLDDFKKSIATSTKFYGTEWKNTTRNWNNYIIDINSAIETAPEEEYAELNELWFKGSCARKVLAVCSQFGLTDERVHVEYKAQIHILNSQNPMIENPFSMFFKRSMHSVSAASTWPANLFWIEICSDTMKELVEIKNTHNLKQKQHRDLASLACQTQLKQETTLNEANKQ